METKKRHKSPALIAAVGVVGGIAALVAPFAPSRPAPSTAAVKVTSVARSMSRSHDTVSVIPTTDSK